MEIKFYSLDSESGPGWLDNIAILFVKVNWNFFFSLFFTTYFKWFFYLQRRARIFLRRLRIQIPIQLLLKLVGSVFVIFGSGSAISNHDYISHFHVIKRAITTGLGVQRDGDAFLLWRHQRHVREKSLELWPVRQGEELLGHHPAAWQGQRLTRWNIYFLTKIWNGQ